MDKTRYLGIEASKESMNIRKGCKLGDYVLCMEDQKFYGYDGSNWAPMKQEANLNISNYEINKSAYGSLPAYDRQRIYELEDKINDWENSSGYFMLLCNDIKYYTVLRRTQHKKASFPDLGQAVSSLLLERNYSIHFDGIEKDYFEIWVKDPVVEEVYMFALFPYDWGVINFG